MVELMDFSDTKFECSHKSVCNASAKSVPARRMIAILFHFCITVCPALTVLYYYIGSTGTEKSKVAGAFQSCAFQRKQWSRPP